MHLRRPEGVGKQALVNWMDQSVRIGTHFLTKRVCGVHSGSPRREPEPRSLNALGSNLQKERENTVKFSGFLEYI